MYLIALKMLFGDKNKYIGMIIGIAFSSLIMTQQPAILIGLLSRTYNFIKDVRAPDIWVMDQGVKFVEENKPIRSTMLNVVKGIEGVKWAVPMSKSLISAMLPDGNYATIDLTGIDDATMIGAPSNMLDSKLSDLSRDNAILVDKDAASTRLSVKNTDGTKRPLLIGDVVEINDKKAIVVGYIKSKRNFVLQPQALTTVSRYNYFMLKQRKKLSYILVKAKKNQNQKELCASIQNKTGLKALTHDEFCEASLNYWMRQTGIPINFGTSVLMGFLIGSAIVGQTFFNFVAENIRYYATLKAMGLSVFTLKRMVMLQAFMVGVVGYGIGVGLSALFGVCFIDSVLSFKMLPVLLFYSFLGVMIIISFSALLGIKKVIKIDPSIVFRS